MPWTPLSERWASLPLVLAGPILRRVEKDLVTVWVVSKEPYVVNLLIFDAAGKVIMRGKRTTVSFGPGFHVATVTARPESAKATHLKPGVRYSYNVSWGDVLHLKTPGVFAADFTLPGQGKSLFGYGADDALPSFSLPPSDPSKLRLLHGSCRRAQGDDRDALEGVDELIADSHADPDHRPHHLLLTGDQYYGDNVAEALLYEIIQANSVLFGHQEDIPGPNVTADKLLPGSRDEVLRKYGGQEKAEYTYKRSHLLSLSEYLSMYAYAWSDVLWPARGNWADQSTARGGVPVPKYPPGQDLWGHLGLATSTADEYAEMVQKVEYLRDGLPAVRRALANVPTLMMFDDHDFTDSWAINNHWVTSVLNSPFGARHMRNAITAYAICQGWGNRPDDFEVGQPGAELFDAAQLWVGSGGLDLEADANLHALIGPAAPQPVGDGTYQLMPAVPASVLRWDYSVTYPTHRIIATDCRTHCGYPDTGEGFNGLIAPGLIGDQLPVDDAAPPITFVITGAPVLGYGVLEAGQEATARTLGPTIGNAEEWVYNIPAQQTLLAALAHLGRRGTTVKGMPGRQSRVVVLSGDVHFGYTARLQYWAERPYGHTTQSPVDMVLAQLVASAFKNERPQTDAWHRDGMNAFEGPSADRWSLGPAYISEGAGWINDGGADVQVGTRAQQIGPDVALRIAGTNQVRFSSPDSGTQIRELTKPTDFAFRAEWVFDPRFFTLDKPGETPVKDLEKLDVDLQMQGDDAATAQKIAALDAEIAARKARIAGASIVGRNQFGEVTLTYANGVPATITQAIWWRELRVADEAPNGGAISPLAPLTVTTVSLAFDTVARPFG